MKSPSPERRHPSPYIINKRNNEEDVPVANVESYLRIKKRGALTTCTRYLVMRNAQLIWFNSKQEAQYRRGVLDIGNLISAKLMTIRGELSLSMVLEGGKEFIGRTFNRADLAKWITAFHRFNIKSEPKACNIRSASSINSESPSNQCEMDDLEKPPRHVTFHSNVIVRVIPVMSAEEMSKMFYTRKDMIKFSAQATSLFCRTEEVVNLAYSTLSASLKVA